MNKYSILIPTVGQFQRVSRCIEKLTEHTDKDAIGEIIIVADKVNSEMLARMVMLYLSKEVPISLILNHQIVGRPKAVEMGLNAANFNTAIILENGVEAFVGWLDALADEFSTDRAWVSARPLEDVKNGSRTMFMNCSMIDISTFRELGGFDSVRFSPFGLEDLDLLNRMIDAGKRPCVAKRAGTHHPELHTTVAPVHCSGSSYQERMREQNLKYVEKYSGRGITYDDIEEVN
jgi:hypothetical protein